jgi:hypothetical protein
MSHSGPKSRIILGVGGADELEPKHIAVGAGLGPHDLGVLDRLMVGRRANTKRADLAHGNVHIDCDSEAANAGVEGQSSTAHRAEKIDLRIECPAPRTTTGTAVDGDVSATLRKNRRESVSNGCHGTAEHIQARDPWLAFSTGYNC